MAEPPENGNDATITWRFSMLDLDGPWGWSSFQADHAVSLREKSAEWERLKHGELFGRGGNKRIPAQNLCREAQRRLVELKLDDYGHLWELHIKGKPRLWGLRTGHIFYPIWWDPEHTVCPSKLRNT